MKAQCGWAGECKISGAYKVGGSHCLAGFFCRNPTGSAKKGSQRALMCLYVTDLGKAKGNQAIGARNYTWIILNMPYWTQVAMCRGKDTAVIKALVNILCSLEKATDGIFSLHLGEGRFYTLCSLEIFLLKQATCSQYPLFFKILVDALIKYKIIIN